MIAYQVSDFDNRLGSSAIASCILEPDSLTVLYSNKPFQRLIKNFQIRHDKNILLEVFYLRKTTEKCLHLNSFEIFEKPDWALRFEFLPVSLSSKDGTTQRLIQCQIMPMPEEEVPNRANIETVDNAFHRILRHFPHSTWVCSLSGEVFWTNRASTIYAYNEEERYDLTNADYVHRIHPDDMLYVSKTFSRAMVENKFEPFRFRIRDHEGIYRWFLFTAAPVLNDDGSVRYWTGASINIDAFVTRETDLQSQVDTLTNRVASLSEKIAETQALMTNVQKIELVTHLAGGIAHDLNNLLFIIDIHMQKLNRKLQQNDQREHVTAVRSNIRRAARLSTQLSGFSGRFPQNATVFNPADAIAEFHDLLEQAAGAETELKVDVQGPLHNLKVDKTYLENALINLVMNARDALNGRGRITVSVENVTDDASDEEQEFVRFSVHDAGSGIPADMLSRVGEPFFTTKAPGKGTGLGLTMVKNFVENSNGRIEIQSVAASGTTVNILLPKSDQSPESEALISEPEAGGKEAIMLIEDDKEVCQEIGSYLSGLGYDIFTTFNIDSAILLLKGGVKANFIVSDVKTPGDKSVLDLINHVEATSPVPLIFVTGYSAEIVIEEGLIGGRYPVLFKPFDIRHLAAKIRRKLDEKRPKDK